MDNYILASLKSIGQGCFEVGPGYSIMTNLHLLFDLHLIRCLYLFPSMWVVLLLLELCCSSKSPGAVLQNTDDLPEKLALAHPLLWT